MSVITSIEPQQKKNRKNVFIDGSFWAGLSDFVIIKNGLKVGKEIDEDTKKKILFEEEYEKQLKYATKLLAGSDRTVEELKTRLKKRNVPSDVINAVISKLEGYGFISDDLYLKRFVENKKGYGYYYFIEKLKEKGIDKEKIKETLDSILTKEEERNRGIDLLKNQIKRWKKVEPKKKLAKMVSFLKNRGFRSEVIYSLVKIDDIGTD